MRNNLCLMLVLTIAVACAGACTREKVQPTRIAVTGEADARTPPDTAVVTLSVVTQSRGALDAQRQNARKSEAVIAAIKQAAGDGAEISTSGYRLEPQRDYSGGRMPRIVGYEAQNTVTVMTRALDNTGAIVDAASGAGANSIEGIRFILREGERAQSDALAEATKQARAKADGIARALGGRVVRVVEQREGGANIPPPDDRPMAMATGVEAQMRLSGRPAPTTPVQAGSLDVRAQVTLVVEIEAQP